jgi:hypothetical protein
MDKVVQAPAMAVAITSKMALERDILAVLGSVEAVSLTSGNEWDC